MKNAVKFSLWCIIITISIIVLLCCAGIALYYQTKNIIFPCILLGIMVVLGFLALFYSPQYIVVKRGQLEVRRILRTTYIPLENIHSVRTCPPTMAERNVFGSFGFCGHWGWFSEPTIGRYFAYYGKSSDCFLVTLKNGRKYLLGCENSSEMFGVIASRIKKPFLR